MLSGNSTNSYLLEYEMLGGAQLTCGIPVEENHSEGHSKYMSSWFPNTLAHGIPLFLVGETALSQYKLAFWIAMLFAVITSPRYTTKSEKEEKGKQKEKKVVLLIVM